MNRDQKAAVVEQITAQIQESEAVFAVDYRGISVPQAAELRARLHDADASFRIVKNTLTTRAADQAGAEGLKPLLEGPTALTFVRGDAAAAAKAIADFARGTADLLPFKGGMMNGDVLEPSQIQAIARLPTRDVLYGQLVGVVASPITGVVRTLNALISGLAIQLGAINEKKQSGEIPAGDAPAAPAAEAPAAEAVADEAPDQDAEHEPAPVQPDQAEGEDDPAETSDTSSNEEN
jgi:large subunit ribosomal protein L10